ncbi:uncharacterized protein LOC133311737 [Gastrolobium bilobum]|uniref:uncharacterized protein LOC133311737 n=1 Tax=Gastrolobium bilobum TaxID=150636 RepID=UPI002AAF23FA|nr:uncharacterized protein LOC133311737 [Gastrolobium bilobum]
MGFRFSQFRHLTFLLVLSFLSIHIGTSLDTISSSNFLKDPETLSSSEGLFQLGFFTPPNSTFSYLGIWYSVSRTPQIWVANRDQPVKDSSGTVKISEDGNLVVMNGQKEILWSTNVSNIIASNTTAQLLNTGNLVLQETTTGSMLWQSFQHPCNSLLQQMKVSRNKTSGERMELTSWKSPQDPSIGNFSTSLEGLNIPEVFTWRGSQPYWRSGPWNGQIFLGIPNMTTNYLDGFYIGGQDEGKGNYYLTYAFANQSELIIYGLGIDGNTAEVHWDYGKRNWWIYWESIISECDVYGICGAFGSCDSRSSPICTCLTGFEPRNVEEWNTQNWTSGCVRKGPLQCGRVTNGDGFLKLPNTKVPDFIQWSSSLEDVCRTRCLQNCSCIAYAYDAGVGCMSWSANLIDIQRFSSGGTNLYIRVPYSELEEKKKNATMLIAVTVIIGTIFIVTCGYVMWKRTTRGEKNHKRIQVNDLSKLPELSQFELEKLATATNNFHLANKLGQGGFGPVYKGTLEGGQEIAVKRLSRTSGQGLEEFMNEVGLISKLQHRNLVRLLGCCIEGDEKILIYEYMPNRSLDAYMFDPSEEVLNWEKRFNIIEGIARGLLYLHRDSRLRIIHRDLKLSNILLDEELNPKISDFGMARIFCRSEDEANTRRIVGTCGYISPEYAMEGLFSEKSDVFSFGVLLLEVVSRRKNTSFYEDAVSLSLLGYAWKLWNDDNITSLIDPEISNPNFHADIFRCIHIGLLCVQELARDRPTMTAVLSMLNNETVNLPPPRQPAFIQRQTMLDVGCSHKSDAIYSMNYASVTNTISSSYFLKDPETLSSTDGLFQLGFFTPPNSTFSYLGIWYNVSKNPQIWVANRDQPVKDSSGTVKISEDGNLVVMNGQKEILWSTNVSNIIASNTTAQLLNTGNLVLQETTSGSMVWQSFQHPCNALLQQMKLSANKTSGERIKLTSWKSPQDPSIGNFSTGLESLKIPEIFTWRGSQPYWRSGPWNGQIFLGIPDMYSDYLDGFYLGGQDEGNGNYYLTYTYANQSELRIYGLSIDGNIYEVYWDYGKRNWMIDWEAINSDCDVYGICGVFGSCDSRSSPICTCLTGFEPRNVEEWNTQNWTSGCVRKEPLQCERVKNGSEAGNGDGFLKLPNSKVPDFIQWSSSLEDVCRTQCLQNCSCIAYAYDAGVGCMSWSAKLIDIQRFSINGGTDLYIRVPYSELDTEKTFKKNQRSSQVNDLSKLPELSQFELEKLATATNNFHLANKLGQGGFGLVYKGTLEGGQEIAVKRLSRTSGQGLEEFMNEVVLISKLQHRNLVRLLGCCIEGDEKILVYEYMPNRSLDAYMFDPSAEVLNWEKRFNIIEGIARGLLYLHRDSRLRIIHRDLKLSNILLDEELNPKISDFGMARIFGRSEDEANTRRIVGTCGYISPEYAMEGLFSEKSDVFSFGVLLLEVVSRRKNTSFYEDAVSLSLLGYAWKLWNDDNITSLIDPEISNPSFHADIFRCIHIGLLCVQELARDRPTMTAVLSMLNNETVNLSPPRQPAFIQRQNMLDSSDLRLWLDGQDYTSHLTTKADSVAANERTRWKVIDAQLCSLIKATLHPSIKQIFRLANTCEAIWSQAKALYTNDTQRIYGVCQKLMTTFAPQDFNCPMTEYLGKAQSLLHGFNELLPLTGDVTKEQEQRNTLFMLFILYGLPDHLSVNRDQILGSVTAPTLDSVMSTLLRILPKPFTSPTPPVTHVLPDDTVDSPALAAQGYGRGRKLSKGNVRTRNPNNPGLSNANAQPDPVLAALVRPRSGRGATGGQSDPVVETLADLQRELTASRQANENLMKTNEDTRNAMAAMMNELRTLRGARPENRQPILPPHTAAPTPHTLHEEGGAGNNEDEASHHSGSHVITLRFVNHV